jgi:hypothetical protein
MNRKGMSLMEMPSIFILFVVSFVVLAFTVLITSNISSGLTAGSNAVLVLGNTTSGLSSLGSYAPTIAVVIAGALIIGLLVSSFMRQGV